MGTKREITSLEEDFKKIGLFISEEEEESGDDDEEGGAVPDEKARYALQKKAAPKVPGSAEESEESEDAPVEEGEGEEDSEPQEEWNFDKKKGDDDDDDDDADDKEGKKKAKKDDDDDDDDDDDEKEEDIDEARVVVLRKKTGQAANLKRRMSKLYYKRHKSQIQRAHKQRARKPAVKRMMKLRSRLTKNRPHRPGMRTVLKMGTERVSNLLERVENILESISPINRGEFVKAFANIAIISQTLSEKFNEAAQELKSGDLWESAKVMEELAEETARLAEEVSKPNSLVYKTDLEATFGEAIQSVLEGLELFETMWNYPTYDEKGADLDTYEPIIPGREIDKSDLPDDADMDAAKEKLGTDAYPDPHAPYKKLADLGPEGAQIRASDKTNIKGSPEAGSKIGKEPAFTGGKDQSGPK